MCNACGFLCCASDVFEQCGCEGCAVIECHEKCEDCGRVLELCNCDPDSFVDDFEEG